MHQAGCPAIFCANFKVFCNIPCYSLLIRKTSELLSLNLLCHINLYPFLQSKNMRCGKHVRIFIICFCQPYELNVSSRIKLSVSIPTNSSFQPKERGTGWKVDFLPSSYFPKSNSRRDYLASHLFSSLDSPESINFTS